MDAGALHLPQEVNSEPRPGPVRKRDWGDAVVALMAVWIALVWSQGGSIDFRSVTTFLHLTGQPQIPCATGMCHSADDEALDRLALFVWSLERL